MCQSPQPSDACSYLCSYPCSYPFLKGVRPSRGSLLTPWMVLRIFRKDNYKDNCRDNYRHRSAAAIGTSRAVSLVEFFFWNCNCDYRLPGQAPPTALYKATNAVTADVRPTASSFSALNSVRWASRTCKKSVSPASYLSCARSSACVLARTASLKLDRRARERS